MTTLDFNQTPVRERQTGFPFLQRVGETVLRIAHRNPDMRTIEQRRRLGIVTTVAAGVAAVAGMGLYRAGEATYSYITAERADPAVDCAADKLYPDSSFTEGLDAVVSCFQGDESNMVDYDELAAKADDALAQARG